MSGKPLPPLDKYPLVVFDFDGTLVDSNPIKLGAFNVCFAEFLADYPEILRYCHSNHHTIRTVKFRHVYENILKRAYTPEIEKKLLAVYAGATTEAIINAPEIPGALEFVREASTWSKTALLSSTPHEYLIPIIKGRGWESLFTYIQGAPVKKSEWITATAARLGLSKHGVLFIGDTDEDARSAAEAGVDFIRVEKDFSALKAAA